MKPETDSHPRTVTIRYKLPENWIRYDKLEVVEALTGAKAAILSLTTIPYQRSWADELQVVQLKREIAGTTRIEGADFTDSELEAALTESPAELWTRSQRQAAATKNAYRWIAELPTDYPVNEETILHIHRLVIEGADDDHCPPGTLRGPDQNVSFGAPRHRGVEGGDACRDAFRHLSEALAGPMKNHDAIIQSLAMHCHLAAIHPFLDGNGRTVRALEALMLQRVGLRDTLFIAMSNYYYEEKNAYLTALASVRAGGSDLTPFLLFGLHGVELQCRRLLEEIRKHLAKALYRDLMMDLFNRLRTPRKRVIADRQIKILNLLLEEELNLEDLASRTQGNYSALKNPSKAFLRDMGTLLGLGALETRPAGVGVTIVRARLEWPSEITETEFFRIIKRMPKARTRPFLDH